MPMPRKSPRIAKRHMYTFISPGALTAPGSSCLVLLRSRPDTVHRFPANFKSLASLQRSLGLHLALLAFKTEHQSLGLLRLLVENRLRLTSITLLLHIVSTLSLRSQRSLSGLVLGYLMLGMLVALLAVSVLGFGNVNHFYRPRIRLQGYL